MRKSQRSPKNFEMKIFKDLEDMELDMSKQILDWAEIRLKESRASIGELAHEGTVVFKDESVTLHREGRKQSVGKGIGS